jgi:hypothetical protein
VSEKTEKEEAYTGHYDGLNEGSYVKAADFKLGQQITVTLEAAHRRILEGEDGKKKRKGIFKFTGKEKEWVSNKTNQICIAKMFGDQVSGWIGKRVTFVVEICPVGGVDKYGFRVAGSPDISAPMIAEIKLPKRRPVNRKLVPTKVKGAPVIEQPTEPTESTDLDEQPPAGDF